eukprot:31186-Eustigmatos_ZCMA.PRE.1
MRVLTGDETGLVKAVGLEGQRIVIAGRQTREREIKAMCWTRAGGDFAVARSDGVVALWQDSPQVSLVMKVLDAAFRRITMDVPLITGNQARSR